MDTELSLPSGAPLIDQDCTEEAFSINLEFAKSEDVTHTLEGDTIKGSNGFLKLSDLYSFRKEEAVERCVNTQHIQIG